MNSSPLLTDLIFTANTAGNHGGGLHAESSNAVVRDCVFSGNDAGSGAGAWVEGPGRPRFVRCVFEGNTAGGMGGAVATDLEADLVLTGCDFLGNTGASGGAVCVTIGTATIEDCTIDGNTAEFGGGICLQSSAGVTVRGTSVDSNEASYQGGGIYTSDSVIDVVDCTVTDNVATLQGGAVWMLLSSGTFTRTAVTGNRSGGFGDGFFLDSSGLVMNAGEFASNGVAIHVQPGSRAPVDARWNWWGDPSGPYHASLNPAGLGDEVTDGVNFTPWNVTSSAGELPEAVLRSWSAIKSSYR
ncbi:MAG: right-handed parallel beta-helix repeat-containing protein [Candidatus Eisenbacteria bacterium]